MTFCNSHYCWNCAVIALVSASAVAAAVNSQRAVTYPDDVGALLPLRQLMLSSSSVKWRGWWSANSSKDTQHLNHTQHAQQPLDPCGQLSCGQGMPLECAWQGVSCSNGRVVGLDLHCDQAQNCSVPMDGPLPASITQLTALTSLSLANNKFSGSLPRWPVGSLLTVLDLHSNRLSGPLPDDYAISLTQLQVLHLSGNTLTGSLPWQWSRLRQLSTLCLADNNLQGLVPLSWGGFASLQDLDLSDNCGLCGALPAMATAKVGVANTGLNDSCGPSGVGRCGSSSYSSLMVALSVLMGGLALCLLQRHVCWRLRVAAEMTRTRQARGEGVEAGLGRAGSAGIAKPIPSFIATVELSPSQHHLTTPPAVAGGQNFSNCCTGGEPQPGWARSLEGAPGCTATTAELQHLGQSEIVAAGGSTACIGDVAADVPCPSGPHRTHSPSMQDKALGWAVADAASCSPTIIVMPDGQEVALAVPESGKSAADTVPDSRRCDLETADGEAAAAEQDETFARQQERQQRQQQPPQQQHRRSRLWHRQQHQRRRTAREMAADVLMFLILQPVRPEDVAAQTQLPRPRRM